MSHTTQQPEKKRYVVTVSFFMYAEDDKGHYARGLLITPASLIKIKIAALR